MVHGGDRQKMKYRERLHLEDSEYKGEKRWGRGEGYGHGHPLVEVMCKQSWRGRGRQNGTVLAGRNPPLPRSKGQKSMMDLPSAGKKLG